MSTGSIAKGPILPCPHCDHDLWDYDLTEDGIGTKVTVTKYVAGPNTRGEADVPGVICPNCGNEAVI